MDKIYFIAPYVSEKAERNMSCTPSSITYSQYFISAFTQAEINKQVIVLSLCSSKSKVYFTKKRVEQKKHIEIYFRTLPTMWGVLAIRLTQIWLYLQVFCFLLSHATKDDTIVIYHDYGLSYFYKVFRRFIRSKFIYLVGEVFNAVYDRGYCAINKECKRLSNADAYIYANDIMPKLLGNQKPFGVCYGNYIYCNRPKNKDDKTHVLYAGKISTGIINDAFIALDVINFLPNEYVMHIAGYGEGKDIDTLKERIRNINRKAGFTKTIYEGNLRGEEYEELLSKCSVGLCTRTLRNELSNYCFPSKTLVYMTHDLIPICPHIDILKCSKISNQLVFVEGVLTPKSIAEAIIQSKERLYGCSNKELLNNIEQEFYKQINYLFK